MASGPTLARFAATRKGNAVRAFELSCGSVESTLDAPAAPWLPFRKSIAARITLLVAIVLLAAGASAWMTLGELRAMQSSFDRLTEIYVVFNQRLAAAHVQAVRVHEQIRTHQHDGEGLEPEIDAAFLNNFEIALTTRNQSIALARQPIDEALGDPARYGGEEQLEDLRRIQALLNELEDRVALDELDDPRAVLSDVQTQNQITQLFKSLSAQSSAAIGELRAEVRAAQVETERLTIGLTLATTILGVLATIGVVLTLRPLRQLAQSVRDLGRGDWGQHVEVPGSRRGDEVSQLAQEFNTMASALQERERRLLRGERLAAAGQLAAQITHEIRNPLSAVALNVELLEDELQGASPEGRHLLREITKEVDRLTQVTEDYLSFARRPLPELVALDLVEQVRSLLEFMRPELEHSGLRVEVALPDTPLAVMGDANQLRQALMNLVRNAQEAALDDELRDEEREPWVGVTVEAAGDAAVVRVEDNGGGIPLPSEQFDRIFEAFYTRKARGTGLGLSTVQQILVDHRGAIRVAHTGPGGTCFEVELPATVAGTDDLADRAAAP